MPISEASAVKLSILIDDSASPTIFVGLYSVTSVTDNQVHERYGGLTSQGFSDFGSPPMSLTGQVERMS